MEVSADSGIVDLIGPSAGTITIAAANTISDVDALASPTAEAIATPAVRGKADILLRSAISFANRVMATIVPCNGGALGPPMYAQFANGKRGVALGDPRPRRYVPVMAAQPLNAARLNFSKVEVVVLGVKGNADLVQQTGIPKKPSTRGPIVNRDEYQSLNLERITGISAQAESVGHKVSTDVANASGQCYFLAAVSVNACVLCDVRVKHRIRRSRI